MQGKKRPSSISERTVHSLHEGRNGAGSPRPLCPHLPFLLVHVLRPDVPRSLFGNIPVIRDEPYDLLGQGCRKDVRVRDDDSERAYRQRSCSPSVAESVALAGVGYPQDALVRADDLNKLSGGELLGITSSGGQLHTSLSRVDHDLALSAP